MMATKLVMASDLFLDLQLYRIPDWALDKLRASFPFLEIVEVNTPRTAGEPLPEAAEVYWGNRVTPEIIAGLPNLRWLHFGSVGIDKALVPEVKERGIVVTNSAGTVAPAMAASAIAFIAGLARGFHHAWSDRRSGTFGRPSFDANFETLGDLDGQSVLIVGYGDVGSRLGKGCRALGMHVSGIRRGSATPDGDVEEFFELARLAEAVAGKDFVVDLLPLTSQTRGVFDAAVIGRIERSAYFVNVGRGETVDQEALVSALREGRIAGAGLDVYERFPLPPDSPLLELDNVILTPHVAGLSRSYWPRAYEVVHANIERYMANEPLVNTRDLSREY